MNRLLTKTGGFLLVLLFLALPASAQVKKIVFTPQWHANAQFAGYIIAREMGFYEEEGLDVTIKYPESGKSSLEMLRNGNSDMVTAILMNAIISKTTQEIDLVNVMQTSQHAALCLAFKKPIKDLSINSLNELRVGLWSRNTAVSAVAMNNKYHLNWNIVPFSTGIKLLTYGVMDAISVMEYNELLRLKYTGRDVSEHSVFKMSEHGYDIPEEGVYCTREYYDQNTEAVKAFVRATKKGWDWCRKHQDETVDIVTKEMNQEYVNNSKVFQSAGLKVVLKKQELTPGKVNFKLQRDQFNKAARTLLDAELINTIPDFQTFIAQ